MGRGGAWVACNACVSACVHACACVYMCVRARHGCATRVGAEGLLPPVTRVGACCVSRVPRVRVSHVMRAYVGVTCRVRTCVSHDVRVHV